MRSRAGTYSTFVRRYQPVEGGDGGITRPWDDPQVLAAFDRIEGYRLVWTIVDGEGGRTYLVPGFATVNYVARVLCTKPWPDEEMHNPGYAW